MHTESLARNGSFAGEFSCLLLTIQEFFLKASLRNRKPRLTGPTWWLVSSAGLMLQLAWYCSSVIYVSKSSLFLAGLCLCLSSHCQNSWSSFSSSKVNRPHFQFFGETLFLCFHICYETFLYFFFNIIFLVMAKTFCCVKRQRAGIIQRVKIQPVPSLWQTKLYCLSS